MIKIITAPSEVLSQKAEPVKKIDKKLIDEMKQALLLAKDPEGVGLAAPQVGKPLSIFVIKPTPKSPIKVFINPKIVLSIKYQVLSKKSDPIPNTKYKIQNTRLEGCLSLPNIWGQVKRKPSLTLEYIDEKGKNHTKIFKGFMATIIQHEIDHLSGVLFTERVLEQNGQFYKSHKNEKGEDEFEEIEL
ncbi:MAG: peptide deformylase [Candidatus Levybacteria bacterium RIFCSPLOWO2_01_FULL_38_21]|nr:MAG: peptide deformylase [Candidatus Levybacteria bacterium RIFCSPLOWO2_01_FULL_38_21]